MLSVQRQFGRLKKRGADESQVSVLLKDFEEADLLLAKVRTSPKPSTTFCETRGSIMLTDSATDH